MAREITMDGLIVIDDEDFRGADVLELMLERDTYAGWKRDGDKRIVELESALWYLIGDVEAAHRSHIPAPGDPPITDKEIANLLRAQSLLANYRPDEYETNGH